MTGLWRHELAKKRIELLFLPGAHAGTAHEDRRRLDARDVLLEERLPGLSRGQLPFIEPGEDAPILQSMSDRLHGRLIRSIVTEEDVEGAGCSLAFQFESATGGLRLHGQLRGRGRSYRWRLGRGDSGDRRRCLVDGEEPTVRRVRVQRDFNRGPDVRDG
jgi:hypothetical protein